MPRYLVDVQSLTLALAPCDDRTPGILFGLLAHFSEHGPFAFDAEALSQRLSSRTDQKSRVNALELASLQSQLEPFFESTPTGWVPNGALFQRRET